MHEKASCFGWGRYFAVYKGCECILRNMSAWVCVVRALAPFSSQYKDTQLSWMIEKKMVAEHLLVT